MMKRLLPLLLPAYEEQRAGASNGGVFHLQTEGEDQLHVLSRRKMSLHHRGVQNNELQGVSTVCLAF